MCGDVLFLVQFCQGGKKQFHQVGMNMEKEYWRIQERGCEIAN